MLLPFGQHLPGAFGGALFDQHVEPGLGLVEPQRGLAVFGCLLAIFRHMRKSKGINYMFALLFLQCYMPYVKGDKNMRTGPHSLRIEALSELFGQRFIDDVLKSIPAVSGMKQLLSWLAQDGSQNTKALIAIFRNEASEKYSSVEMSKILGEGIVGWYREAYHRLKKSTRVHYKKQLLDGFQALSLLPDRNYPAALLTAEDFNVIPRRSISDSLDLDKLQDVFGEPFIADVVTHSSNIPQMRHFLTWLSTDRSRSSTDLIAVLRGEQPNDISDIQRVGLVVTSIRNWKRASASKLKPNTMGQYSSGVGFSFEALGRFPDSRYPKYDRRLVPSGERHVGSSHTLGDLNWPEVEHLRGAEKERECLAIVRNAAVSQLQRVYDLFKFGQNALLDRAPDCPDRNSWNAVSALLKAAHEQLMCCGSLDYGLISEDRNFSDPSIWIAAGAPDHFFCGPQNG